MLSIKNLTVALKDDKKKEILHDISFDFVPRKIYAIMGPNGSGKSTLARSIMGEPLFFIKNGEIFLDNTNVTYTAADKRARSGLFLSAQSPLAIPGVTVRTLLRSALKKKKISPLELKNQIDIVATQLSIAPELLDRSLNEGFSGGERKKMEALQMAILNPNYIILDEIDTGVDVDALKIIALFLKEHIKDTDKTLIIITHSTRILHYLMPDETLVINDGQISNHGDHSLATKIEKDGFGGILDK